MRKTVTLTRRITPGFIQLEVMIHRRVLHLDVIANEGGDEKENQVKQGSESSSEDKEKIIEDLDTEILQALGNRLITERVLGQPIPNSITLRLSDILKKGLPKGERENLLKDNAPPKNCVIIDPPKLNEEIKKLLSEASMKSDERIVEKQRKITVSLALLLSAITEIIKQNRKLSSAQLALVKKLSESARLMVDVQRDEILTRKRVIMAIIDQSHKTVLESTPADEWLFGDKLSERLKADKILGKSGQELKNKKIEEF
ncbi:uncharacterized protein LOC135169777 [Diachasmimorpha longicaudata]|uniref:uncharacterized protein LOC135169777 n=1 Tax=Diachasmimorpha longicaudata TaxID=58733 RepID=UPI0030B8F19A